ncbi:MAG TPA: acetylxylan esterase [Acidobacteriota bacterium]|nr:acetylxylan esterase [Acidobacteriota bacterium]
MKDVRYLLLAVLTVVPGTVLSGQPTDSINYDEAKVPNYVLPDPLVLPDGSRVETPEDWWLKQRPRLLRLFETEMYGKAPRLPAKIDVKELGRDSKALGGLAERKELRLNLTGLEQGPFLHVLIYLPSRRTGPVPVFLALNFNGNHSITPDPGVTVVDAWASGPAKDAENPQTIAAVPRGAYASRWPLSLILSRGYGVVTAYYGEIQPDDPEKMREGLLGMYLLRGQSSPALDQWGAIGAWAWGMRRMLDAVKKQSDIDGRRVIALGHSRLGKTALWAAAQDQRFVAAISNNSGCGGAALSRRRFGETVESINRAFPHWFCGNFKRYGGREEELPFDQHSLLALIAPRPLYVASAAEDLWADPRGEFLAAKAADPVYRLLGTDGLQAEEMPPVDQPVFSTISYHVRSGGHDLTEADWGFFLEFADRYVRRRE